MELFYVFAWIEDKVECLLGLYQLKINGVFDLKYVVFGLKCKVKICEKLLI